MCSFLLSKKQNIKLIPISLNTKIEAKSKKGNIYAYEIRNEKLYTAFALLN